MNKTSQVVLGDIRSMRDNVLALALLVAGALVGIGISVNDLALTVAGALAIGALVALVLYKSTLLGGSVPRGEDRAPQAIVSGSSKGTVGVPPEQSSKQFTMISE